MGVVTGLYMYDVVVKSSRSLSHLLMSFFFLVPTPSSNRAGGRYSRLMAQMTWFRPWTVLFGVRTMNDIFVEICLKPPPPQKKGGVNRHFQAKVTKY